MIHIKATGHLTPVVFLAGSIEMGKAVDWQAAFANRLADIDVVVLNPRRDDWDSSWEQSVHNHEFNKQVNWELGGIERADIVVVNFIPDTYSPITIGEFGLACGTKPDKTIVHCPHGFWRKGNIDVMCQRYHVAQAYSFNELVNMARVRINQIS